MPRVKGGTVTRKRRKKVIKLAKGYYGSKHTLYKVANQQVMKSLMYAFRDRRQKKRDFRKLWITRTPTGAERASLSRTPSGRPRRKTCPAHEAQAAPGGARSHGFRATSTGQPERRAEKHRFTAPSRRFAGGHGR
jgi:hypothetical protein